MNGTAFSRVSGATVWVLIGMLAVSAVLLHVRLIANLDFDGENLLAEGETLYSLRSAATGQPLYRDFTHPPHTTSAYMPLFYLVPGLVARVLHVDTAGTVLTGRVYVYACWLGIGIVIYALARQANCIRKFAVLAAFFWLGGQLATQWANAYRPDAPALLLSLGAMWMYRRGERLRYLAGAFVLLVLAFLQKQSAVTALVVILLDECMNRRFVRAAVAFACWIVAAAAVFIVGQIASGGAFALNTFTSLAVYVSVKQMMGLLIGTTLIGATVICGGILALMVLDRGRCPRVWKNYFVAALGLAFLGSARAGATINYYLEPLAVGCVLAGLLVEDWCTRPPAKAGVWLQLGWFGLALGSTSVVLIARSKELPRWHEEVFEHRKLRIRQRQAWEDLLSALAKLGEPVLSEDSYLAVRRDVPPFMANAGYFADMQRAGKFDDAAVLQRIETGRFSAIVTRFRLDAAPDDRGFPLRWTEPMRREYELVESYTIAGGGLVLHVYQPREKIGQPGLPQS